MSLISSPLCTTVGLLVIILFQRWTMSTAMSGASAPDEDEDCHPRRGNGGGRCRHRPGDTAYHP